MKKSLEKRPFYEHFLFLGPVSIIFFITIVLPFFVGLYYSFTDWNGIFPTMNLVYFENYLKIFRQKSSFLGAAGFTIKFAILNSLLIIALGLILAVLLVQPLKYKGSFRVLFYLPQTMGGLILGFIWQFLFTSGFSQLGELSSIPLLQLPWLGTENTAFAGLLIVSTWQNVGYVMVIMTAGFLSIPKSLFESAHIDGAGGMTIFSRIMVPAAMPFLTVSTFWTLAQSLKMFELNMSLTKGGPFGSTVSIAMNIYKEAFQKNRYGLASAESIIFFLMIMILMSIQLSFSKKREGRYS